MIAADKRTVGIAPIPLHFGGIRADKTAAQFLLVRPERRLRNQFCGGALALAGAADARHHSAEADGGISLHTAAPSDHDAREIGAVPLDISLSEKRTVAVPE